MSLSDRIREQRRACGLSQEKVAEFVGVSRHAGRLCRGPAPRDRLRPQPRRSRHRPHPLRLGHLGRHILAVHPRRDHSGAYLRKTRKKAA